MEKKLETAVKALDSKKAVNIEVKKVSEVTVIADYFVIAGGTSNTHVRALADEVEFKMKEAGYEPRKPEGISTGWILLDYYDIIVHVFLPEDREHYNLEKLWVDAEDIDIGGIIEKGGLFGTAERRSVTHFPLRHINRENTFIER